MKVETNKKCIKINGVTYLIPKDCVKTEFSKHYIDFRDSQGKLIQEVRIA